MGKAAPAGGAGSLSETHPDLISQWHPTFNKVTPLEVYAGSNRSVIWTNCPAEETHVWAASIAQRTRPKPSGCAVCAGRQIMIGVNDLATTHPSIAAQWHPTLNQSSPTAVTAGSSKKFMWAGCSVEPSHVWEASVSKRVDGRGCPICSGHQILFGFNDLASSRPDVAKEWDGERNGITPDRVLSSVMTVFAWKCQHGHRWMAAIRNRTLRNDGCPVCSNRKVLLGYNDLATTHPDLLAEWDFERNTIDPATVSFGTGKRAHWVCAKRHRWIAIIGSRSSGHGCRTCAHKSSAPQQALANHLEGSAVVSDLKRDERIDVRWGGGASMDVDMVMTTSLPSGGTRALAVEYDGSYFHRDFTNFTRDEDKTSSLISMGYLVVRVREQSRSKRLDQLKMHHPSLLQVDYDTSTNEPGFKLIIQQIEGWIARERFGSRNVLAGVDVAVDEFLVGRLGDLSRRQLVALIERHGGKPSFAIKSRTSMVVSCEPSSEMWSQAIEWGLPITAPDALLDIIGD